MMFTPWDPEAYIDEWTEKLRTLNEDRRETTNGT